MCCDFQKALKEANISFYFVEMGEESKDVFWAGAFGYGCSFWNLFNFCHLYREGLSVKSDRLIKDKVTNCLGNSELSDLLTKFCRNPKDLVYNIIIFCLYIVEKI